LLKKDIGGDSQQKSLKRYGLHDTFEAVHVVFAISYVTPQEPTPQITPPNELLFCSTRARRTCARRLWGLDEVVVPGPSTHRGRVFIKHPFVHVH
jgi:hypothetical protein